MVFIIKRLPPRYHQITLEEFLFGTDIQKYQTMPNVTSTRTYKTEFLPKKYLDSVPVDRYIEILKKFNNDTAFLHLVPRKSLYREFYIPKKSGGLRKIDAPNDELMDELRKLKRIFENDFGILYHTSAFAYIKKRSTLDAVKRHQANESKWFGKYDLSNFFGSTTLEFVMKMFSMVFPFSEIIKNSDGKRELELALELAFLDGGLPQGTPISPLITNIMMIPIDYTLSNTLRDFNGQRFVYTRYADDFLISSRYAFSSKEIGEYIINTLKGYEAPFSINTNKTRYGSSAGRNWNLGVMLNKDNEITIGHKKKRQFQAMLSSYVMDKKSGKSWDKNDIQVMEGYRSYYRMVEGEAIDRIVAHIGNKFDVNVMALIKADLAA